MQRDGQSIGFVVPVTCAPMPGSAGQTNRVESIATATTLRVCSGSSNPADLTAATAATLASTSVTSGDFTKGAGVSGRKVTVAQKAAISITTGGDATCVVLDDGTDIPYVTTVTTQTLTAGGTVTVPSWDIEFEQAA